MLSVVKLSPEIDERIWVLDYDEPEMNEPEMNEPEMNEPEMNKHPIEKRN